MIVRFLAALILTACLLAGGLVSAQTTGTTAFDFAAWDRLAVRAELVVTEGRASTSALEDLRGQIGAERDRLLETQSGGQARVKTLTAQLDALGPKPEGSDAEAPEITARRDDLARQLAEAKARAGATAEALSRAEGLIAEVNALIRERRTTAIFRPAPSPLNPATWPAAWNVVSDFSRSVKGEVAQAFLTDGRVKQFRARVPTVALLLVLSMILFLRARRWLAALMDWLIPAPQQEGRVIKSLVQSAAEISAPLWGLAALISAGRAADIFSLHGQVLLDAIWVTGAIVIVAFWLADQLFGSGADITGQHLVRKPHRREARLLTLGMGVVYAVEVALTRIAAIMQVDADTQAVLSFPLVVAGGVLLYLSGRAISARRERQTDAGAEENLFGQRLHRTLSNILWAVGVAGPVVAAAGYVTASVSFVFPSILTLGLIGTLIVIHRLAVNVANVLLRMGREETDGATAAATSILIAVVLIAAAPPLLALIWGATTGDLGVAWDFVKTGVPIGSARLTPVAAITFVGVFAIGYTLTRFAQGALRTYVLPHTRLDPGARAAIRTGTGYVGIFVSALVAITSAGIDLSGLAIVAGALSVGIGFGLQAIVSNFVSGLILLIERPIKEGDWIEVGGFSGYVKGVSVRSTEIETFDRATVVVPNSDLITGAVTNWTHRSDVGRVIVPVGVAYGTDTRRVEQILREIAVGHPMVIQDPPPNVMFIGFGADSLNFEIRAILRDVNWMMATRSDMNFEIDRRFREEGIEIPFAQRDLHLKDIDRLEDAIRGGKPPEKKS